MKMPITYVGVLGYYSEEYSSTSFSSVIVFDVDLRDNDCVSFHHPPVGATYCGIGSPLRTMTPETA